MKLRKNRAQGIIKKPLRNEKQKQGETSGVYKQRVGRISGGMRLATGAKLLSKSLIVPRPVWVRQLDSISPYFEIFPGICRGAFTPKFRSSALSLSC